MLCLPVSLISSTDNVGGLMISLVTDGCWSSSNNSNNSNFSFCYTETCFCIDINVGFSNYAVLQNVPMHYVFANVNRTLLASRLSALQFFNFEENGSDTSLNWYTFEKIGYLTLLHCCMLYIIQIFTVLKKYFFFHLWQIRFKWLTKRILMFKIFQ